MNQLPKVFNAGEGVTRKWGGMLTSRGMSGPMAGHLVERGLIRVCGVNGMEAEVMSEEHACPTTHPAEGKGSPHRRGRFNRKGDMGEDGGADLYEAKV